MMAILTLLRIRGARLALLIGVFGRSITMARARTVICSIVAWRCVPAYRKFDSFQYLTQVAPC
jgi:hypothetical protein